MHGNEGTKMLMATIGPHKEWLTVLKYKVNWILAEGQTTLKKQTPTLLYFIPQVDYFHIFNDILLVSLCWML